MKRFHAILALKFKGNFLLNLKSKYPHNHQKSKAHTEKGYLQCFTLSSLTIESLENVHPILLLYCNGHKLTWIR
jgi:xylose isomerase